MVLPGMKQVPPTKKKKLRIGTCSRIMVAAALFWVLMQTTLVPSDTSSNRLRSPRTIGNMLYVHIGKTGGEFLKSQLQAVCQTRKNPSLKEKCRAKFQQQGEPRLSQHTTGYIHVDKAIQPSKQSLDQFTHYLYTIRHPLDRFVSWYIYNHPRSCDPREHNSPSCKNAAVIKDSDAWSTKFFVACFDSLSKFSNPSPECQTVFRDGQAGLNMGHVREANHLFWNYQFYYTKTLVENPEKPFLVIRQEYLKDDLNRVESLLLGSINKEKTVRSWFPAESTHYLTGKVSKQLTDTARQRLCCSLLPELRIYELLLMGSINLSAGAKHQSLKEMLDKCGVKDNWDALACPV